MKFKIPFTFSNINRLKKTSRIYSARFKYKKDTKLEKELENIGVDLTREEYLGICLKTFLTLFVFFLIILGGIMFFLNVKFFYLYAVGIAFLFAGFMFIRQRTYPHLFLNKKQKNLEKNLVPALEDIFVQLNSGIPLFNVLANISESGYGALSEEFKKAVKQINMGEPEMEVLDKLGEKNPSVFFRRSLWQISNGMRAGSNIAAVIKEIINNLNEEQLIQIQNYGGRLNPLVVLYMLIAVIIPALSITFLTIISSIINLPTNTVTLLFMGLFILDIFAQVMFMGLIRSRRPSLL